MATDEKSSWLENLNKKLVTPLVAILTGILGFYIFINQSKLKEIGATLDNISKQQEINLKQKEFDDNLKTTLLSQVREAIKEKEDTNFQNLTLLYINELLSDSQDTAFRERLKTIFLQTCPNTRLIARQNDIDSLKSQENNMFIPVNTPKAANAKANNSGKTTAGFTVDIFYLDDILNEAKPRAWKVSEIIKRAYPGKYTVRVKELPKYINAQSGYRIDENEIHYNNDGMALADSLDELIEKNNVFEKEKPKLRLVNHQWQNYICIFVRNM